MNSVFSTRIFRKKVENIIREGTYTNKNGWERKPE